MTQRGCERWDIFCRVVDNFGDAGVCWRLARQLVAEHSLAVQLWIDDLPALAPLDEGLTPDLDVQSAQGVEVRVWPQLWGDVRPADVVIEAFGCGLPAPYLEAMAAASTRPNWVNLEYLSAEAWVESCHGLPSHHAKLPLTRYFFFPGFTERTGGLLREANLLAERDRFRADAAARAAFWRRLALAGPPRGRVISLFCYPEAPLEAWLGALAADPEPSHLLVPQGALAKRVAQVLCCTPPQVGEMRPFGNSFWSAFAFLDQPGYDRLLWSCDLNFVRGEDSFVRAQWAGRPMVWQPYRQTEEAHLAKLAAFSERYCSAESDAACAPWAAFSRAWSGEGDVAAGWPALRGALAGLERRANAWAGELTARKDLAAALVEFAQKSDIICGSPNS